LLEERQDPAAALAGQTRTSPWDNLSVVHNAGFDLWNYFVGPFARAMPGVQAAEIDPWEEAGERWRRLTAVFPQGFVARAKEQIYSFNSTGLLRRFEYQPTHSGVPSNVNYAAEHKVFGSVVIATRRRMFPTDPDGRPRRDPVLMMVDVTSVEVD
jgi:hypothetical protein